MGTTLKDILSLPLAERMQKYNVANEGKKIHRVLIDGNEFTDYSAFSFIWEKTYVKSPVRSGDGSIGNLNSYPSFITPHLKIDFSMISIDDYRRLMKLMYSKNEFKVTCYDVVYDTEVTNNMYFSTEEMPKLWAIARALNSDDFCVELLGVQDFTIELVGTNTKVPTSSVTFYVNAPREISLTGYEDNPSLTVEIPSNIAIPIGEYAIFTKKIKEKVTENGQEVEKDKEITVRLADETFGDTHQMIGWKDLKSGLKYMDDDAYLIRQDTNLYALWQRLEKEE